MSLEELLKDPKDSSNWKKQRQKLFRIVAGILVLAVGLVIAGIFLISMKKHAATPVAPTDSSAQSKSLAELMRLRNDARDLKNDLHRAKTRAPASKIGAARGAVRPARIVNYDPGDGFSVLETAKSDVYIPTGAVFRARLLTPIKTSVQKTFVMAETINEYRMDMKRRIAVGSRLIGRSHFDPILKGVVVEFSTVVSPAGLETPINALALSRNALPELDGLYFSNKATTYGTALAFGFLSGFADAAREREFTLIGSQPTVSLGNQVLTGFSTASFQVASQMLRDIQANAIEYVVVPAGEQVFVVLTGRYEIASQGGHK